MIDEKRTAKDMMGEASEIHRKILDMLMESNLTTTVAVGILENVKHTLYLMADGTCERMLEGLLSP